MRFLFFLFGLLLVGCILSCWTYVEKYLEFFPSLPWCVCLQLNVIFSTNMWPVLTKLFPASVCWAVKNVKFSEQHLSEPDFWVFLKQRISVWWKYTRTDTLWNLIFFADAFPTFTPEDLEPEFPPWPVLLRCPPVGVSRLQQPPAPGWRRHHRAAVGEQLPALAGQLRCTVWQNRTSRFPAVGAVGSLSSCPFSQFLNSVSLRLLLPVRLKLRRGSKKLVLGEGLGCFQHKERNIYKNV